MIALTYSNDAQRADFSRSTGHNLDTDGGLSSIVTIYLFTNARARDTDKIDSVQDPGGWWGSQFLDTSGAELGSRLWLVSRGKLTQASLLQCASFAKEALQPLIDNGVAATVTTSAERMQGQMNIGLLSIAIQRPKKTAPRFDGVWKVQFGL